jgi:hypothetical protein
MIESVQETRVPRTGAPPIGGVGVVSMAWWMFCSTAFLMRASTCF